MSPSLCLSLLAAKHQMKAENFLYKASCCTYSELSFSIGKESGRAQNSCFSILSFSSFFRVLCLPNQFLSPSFLGLPLPALPALLVSQRDRPSFSGLPFALSPVQSPRFPISCFLYGTAPPMPTQVPSLHHHSSPSAALGDGGGHAEDGTQGGGPAGVGGPLPASPRKPARGPAQVRGGALARPHPRGRRSRDSGLILSR